MNLIPYSYLEQIQYLVCTSQKPTKKRKTQAAFKNCAQLHHWLCYLTDLAVYHGLEDFWHPHFDGGENVAEHRLAVESLALEIGCICNKEQGGQCNLRSYVIVPGIGMIHEDKGSNSAARIELLKSEDVNFTKDYPMLEPWERDRKIGAMTQRYIGSTMYPWSEVRKKSANGENILKVKCECEYCNEKTFGPECNAVVIQCSMDQF